MYDLAHGQGQHESLYSNAWLAAAVGINFYLNKHFTDSDFHCVSHAEHTTSVVHESIQGP